MWIVILLFFLNGVYIYKSAVDEYKNIHAYEEIMEWLSKKEDPVATSNAYLNFLFVNYDKVQFTKSFYDEYTLVSEVMEYIDNVRDYDVTIENLIKSIDNRSQFAFFNQTKNSGGSAKNTKEAYLALFDVKPKEGNYFAVEKFMNAGVTDGIHILIIIAACSFLLIEEREKGIYQLIKTTKRGRLSFYFWKMGALIGVCLISTILLYIFSFVLYVTIYGCDSLLLPIQSVPGFLLSPYKISIAEGLIQFAIFKALAFITITVFVMFTCLLPIKASIVYLLNALAMGISAAMYLGIPRSSKYVILKFVNFFSILDVKNYINSLNYFPFANREIPLLEFNLFIMAVFFIISALLGILAYLSYKKTKTIKVDRKKEISLFNMNVLSNEFVRFFLLQGGLLLLLIYIVSAIYSHDFNEVKSETNQYLKSYVNMLNDMEKEEAALWIDNKLIELEELEKEAYKLDLLHQEGTLSDRAYEDGQYIIREQLSIKPIILILKEQSQYIDRIWVKRAIACDYFYEPLYEDAFGESGRADRYMNGIIIALFAVILIIPSFAYDNQYNMDRLLLVTKKGTNQLVKSRIFISFLVSTLLIVLMKIIRIISLDSRHGISGLSSHLQSIPWFETFPFAITVGGFLILQSVIEIILILFLCLFLIALSMRGKEVVQSLLYGIIFCVCPVVLGLLGFGPATRYWISPFLVSDTILMNVRWDAYINLLIVVLLIIFIYIKSRHKWRGSYGITG